MNQVPSENPVNPVQAKPAYVPPLITTYTSEEIVEQVGPALTCSPSPI